MRPHTPAMPKGTAAVSVEELIRLSDIVVKALEAAGAAGTTGAGACLFMYTRALVKSGYSKETGREAFDTAFDLAVKLKALVGPS